MISKIKKLAQSKKVLGLVLILGLLAWAQAVPLGTINLGFEGVKATVYGVEFRFSEDWEGTYQLHRYQDAEHPLVEHAAYGCVDKIFWTSAATSNDVGLAWDYHHALRGDEFRPDLGIHVEMNPQLEDIDRQGDPLGWNSSDPNLGRRINYWSKNAVKEETDDKIIYHWEGNTESFIIAPAEFWVGFYLVPSESNSGTASHWREGEWQNILTWYRLGFHVWDDAYKDDWLEDPELNMFTSEYEGIVLNEQKLTDYRGGFPIAGWIQGWEKGGWEQVAWEEGAVNSPNAESPQWLQTRGKENEIYTPEELADLKDKLMAKCSFAPSLIGQFLSLYNEPSAQFTYEASMYESGYSDINYEDENNPVVSAVRSPDSSMKETMFFPINILNFGTYAEGDAFSGYRVFYPSCYFRIRMLYGVYGNFKCLWTEELAKDPVIEYPDEIERHGTTVIHTSGPLTPFADLWGGIGGWFTNPLNQLWTVFIMLVIVIVVVTFLNPGLWAGIIGAYQSSRKSRGTGKSRKWQQRKKG